MSFKPVSYVDPHSGLVMANYLATPIFAELAQRNNLPAIGGANEPGMAEQIQPAPQEAPDLAMLGGVFEVIDEQANAVKAEYERALLEAKDTISKLEATKRVLWQQYGLQSAQIVTLQSQSNQTNIAHAAETETAQERIKTLELALNQKCMEAYHLSEEVKHLNKTVEIHNDAFSKIMGLGSSHYSVVTHQMCVAITNIHTEKDKKLQELKEKEDSNCIVQ